MTMSIGLDFGTTNTVATTMNPDAAAEAVHFAHGGESFDAFRSVLCYWEGDEPGAQALRREPWAIEQFLELAGDCRFIQSFKTLPPARSSPTH